MGVRQLWSSFVKTLGLNDRECMDVSYSYHGIPAPDCRLSYLFDKARIDMQVCNEVKYPFWNNFMNYCKSYDLCKALVAFKDCVKYESVDGYTPEDENWFKTCMRGVMELHRDEDMGKDWISNFFSYEASIDVWYWESSDMTHINANLDDYGSVKQCSRIKRDESNELLYALKYAPLLSNV